MFKKIVVITKLEISKHKSFRKQQQQQQKTLQPSGREVKTLS